MHGTTVPLDTNKQQSVARLEALARLMDSRHHHPLRSRWHHRLDPGSGRRGRCLVSAYLIWESDR